MKKITALSRESSKQLLAEVERAATHYYHTPLQTGIDNRTKGFVIERCMPYLIGPRILELGYIDGYWTERLVARGYRVDVVEGAARHIAHARKKFNGVKAVRIFHSLFQEFEPDSNYQTILAGDMIRYVDNPSGFLRRMRKFISPGGVLVATVPNSRSMHRRIGALIGLERDPVTANRRDQEMGNRVSYDRYAFRKLLMDAGYDVELLQGCFLKPLSSRQMAEWSDDLLRAFLELGDELQDYTWMLWAVCRCRMQGHVS